MLMLMYIKSHILSVQAYKFHISFAEIQKIKKRVNLIHGSEILILTSFFVLAVLHYQ